PAPVAGAVMAFPAHPANGGSWTLNAHGLGAKPLRSAPATELLAGMLVAGTPYAATYYNVSDEWILRGLTGAPGIPLGVALPYFGVTAPASAFALPFGQAISRTTYANLFNLISTTYGAGDGSTTFNLPDLPRYLLAGQDARGGAAGSRITAGASGIDGTVLGAAGGAQTVTLITAQMPAHGHGVSDPTHAHAVSDPSHGHGVNDPTHTHNMNFSTGATTNGNISLFGFVDNVGAGVNVATSQASATGVSLHANTTGVAVNAAGTGISIQASGGGGAHQNMPPTRVCNFIMRILGSARSLLPALVMPGLDTGIHHLRKKM